MQTTAAIRGACELGQVPCAWPSDAGAEAHAPAGPRPRAALLAALREAAESGAVGTTACCERSWIIISPEALRKAEL